MQNRLFISLISILLATMGFAQDGIVIKADRLIDGTGAPPVDNAVLVIEGDRITAAGSVTTVTSPPGARIIDLKGHTILPGLMDCHVHISVLPKLCEGGHLADVIANIGSIDIVLGECDR